MQLWQLLLTIFCSTGILLCLVYIIYQLQKQKLESYAEKRIAEHLKYGPRRYYSKTGKGADRKYEKEKDR